MEEGKSRGFQAKMVDLEDFDVEKLVTAGVGIFVTSTYGEGEPPDNAKRFTDWLKNADGELTSDCLAALKFTVFGLGNKQYEHFNRQGKLTNKGLEALGATRVFEYGEGDDDANLELDFETWRSKMWPVLIDQFHPAGKEASTESTGSMRRNRSLDFNTIFVEASAQGKAVEVPLSQVNNSTKYFFTSTAVRVVANRELRGPDAGSTRHMELSLEDSKLSYETADNLAVLPENHPALVQMVCKRLGYDPNQVRLLSCVIYSPLSLSLNACLDAHICTGLHSCQGWRQRFQAAVSYALYYRTGSDPVYRYTGSRARINCRCTSPLH
jgi:NADPH-ferrihemoprotein reductase